MALTKVLVRIGVQILDIARKRGTKQDSSFHEPVCHTASEDPPDLTKSTHIIGVARTSRITCDTRKANSSAEKHRTGGKLAAVGGGKKNQSPPVKTSGLILRY